MPKRLCNSRGKTQARFGRIRLSWRTKKALTQLDDLTQAERMGELTEEAKVKLKEFKKKVRALMPAKVFRRHQSR